jgi:hypothetical protein
VASDRGVVALRKVIRSGIRAVRDGHTLEVPRRYADMTPTYTFELTLPWSKPCGPSLLQEIGDRVLRVLVESAERPADARVRSIAAQLQETASCL